MYGVPAGSLILVLMVGGVVDDLVQIDMTLSSATNSSGTLMFYDLDTPEEQTLISVSLTNHNL